MPLLSVPALRVLPLLALCILGSALAAAQPERAQTSTSFFETETTFRDAMSGEPERPSRPEPQDGASAFEEEISFGEAGELARIRSQEQLFIEDRTAFSDGRTTIEFEEYQISADRMSIDLVTGDVNAEGNVALNSPDSDILASALRYNLRAQEGVAWDVEGVYGAFFFRSRQDEDTEGPSFRRINEDEAIFRGASYTTSTFPVPTYYITGDEVIVYVDDRIFVKNAVLWVWAEPAIPILYLPVYTASFEGGSPWSFAVGYKSDYGGYLGVGYDVGFESTQPSFEDPTQQQVRSSGRLGVRGDLFTQGAVGAGINWRYKLDFKRHIGELSLYGVRDPVHSDRVEAEEGGNDDTRWIYRHRHNTMLGNTIFQWNADWMSDPDIYYDLIDDFYNEERGRMPERRLRGAIEYVQEDYAATIMGEIKDRVTRDRYQDFTDPYDDDLNYEPDLTFLEQLDDEELADYLAENDNVTQVGIEDGDDTLGLSSDRYGRVTERVIGRVATRMMPLFRTPLYWRTEMNAYEALDAGFNEGDPEDDDHFTGGDFYGAVDHLTRFDPRGRFTWLNTLGVGAGIADRGGDDLVANERLIPSPPPLPGQPVTGLNQTSELEDGSLLVDGLRYQDPSTIFLGDSPETASYSDVDPTFLWADYTSRLSARFNDSLRGTLTYFVREVTGYNAGEFYAQSGRLEAFEDIYDFPIDEHWVEGRLDYYLRYPNLNAYLLAQRNLQGEEEMYANERQGFVGGGIGYENETKEFRTNLSTGVEERQARDPNDPLEYEPKTLLSQLLFQYVPRHGRYWTELGILGISRLTEDPAVEPPPEIRARYDEQDTEIAIRPAVGTRIGSKYYLQTFAEYNTRQQDFNEAGVVLERELPDVILALGVSFDTNTFLERGNLEDEEPDEYDFEREYDIKATIRFKQPGARGRLSSVAVTADRDRHLPGSDRDAVFAD